MRILSWYNQEVKFEAEADSMKVLLGLAIKAKANLQEANLREADLRGANLQEADLRRADLCDTNLHRAKITYRNKTIQVFFKTLEEET